MECKMEFAPALAHRCLEEGIDPTKADGCDPK